jgi:NAD+ kinase
MKSFATIGIFAKPKSTDVKHTLCALIEFLIKQKHKVLLDRDYVDHKFTHKLVTLSSSEEITKSANLIMVVGGDGSLLKAARMVAASSIPVVGINRGKLGFLADIVPSKLKEILEPVLAGEYVEEQRALLQLTIKHNNKVKLQNLALNDIVLYNSNIARMLSFKVAIDGQYVMHQRADGLIISTPTGSTGYAMSGGGPILYPTLEAISLLPMFAHSLSSRPIVINNNSKINLQLDTDAELSPKISCDGQVHFNAKCTDTIEITSFNKKLKLIHPQGYSYYAILREKLGWSQNPSSDRVLTRS